MASAAAERTAMRTAGLQWPAVAERLLRLILNRFGGIFISGLQLCIVGFGASVFARRRQIRDHFAAILPGGGSMSAHAIQALDSPLASTRLLLFPVFLAPGLGLAVIMLPVLLGLASRGPRALLAAVRMVPKTRPTNLETLPATPASKAN